MARVSLIPLTIALSVVTLVLAACGSPAAPGSPHEVSSAPATLIGTWTAAGLAPSTSTPPPELPYLDFDDAGTWSASDGCNRVNGTWKLDADAIVTTAGQHSMMACEGAALPTAAVTASRIELSFSRLVLIDADGARTTLSRVTDKSAGPAGLPTGYWVEAPTPEASFLALAADRTFTSNDGCNTLTGSWATAPDDGITLTFSVSTLMACEGVDTWLGDAVAATVDGDTMTLTDTSGQAIGSLRTMRST